MLKIIIVIIIFIILFYFIFSRHRFFGGGKINFKTINLNDMSKTKFNEEQNKINMDDLTKRLSDFKPLESDEFERFDLTLSDINSKLSGCDSQRQKQYEEVESQGSMKLIKQYEKEKNEEINSRFKIEQERILAEIKENVEKEYDEKITPLKDKYENSISDINKKYDVEKLKLLWFKQQLLNDYALNSKIPTEAKVNDISEFKECSGFNGLSLNKNAAGEYFLGFDSNGKSLIEFDKKAPFIEKGNIDTSKLVNWFGYGPDGYFKLALIQAIYPYKNDIFKIYNNKNWRLFTDKLHFKIDSKELTRNLKKGKIYNNQIYQSIYNKSDKKIIFEFNENFKNSHFLKTMFNSINYIFNNSNIEENYEKVKIDFDVKTKTIADIGVIGKKYPDTNNFAFYNTLKELYDVYQDDFVSFFGILGHAKKQTFFDEFSESDKSIIEKIIKEYAALTAEKSSARKREETIKGLVLELKLTPQQFAQLSRYILKRAYKNPKYDDDVYLDECVEFVLPTDIKFNSTFSLVDIDLNSNKKYSLFNETYKKKIVNQLQYVLNDFKNVMIKDNWYTITQQTFTETDAFKEQLEVFLKKFCERCGDNFDFITRPSLIYKSGELCYKTRYYDYVLKDDKFVEIKPNNLPEGVYPSFYINIISDGKIYTVNPGEKIDLTTINENIPIEKKIFKNDFIMNANFGEITQKLNNLNNTYESAGLKFELVNINKSNCDKDFWFNNDKMKMVLNKNILTIEIKFKEEINGVVSPCVKTPDAVILY